MHLTLNLRLKLVYSKSSRGLGSGTALPVLFMLVLMVTPLAGQTAGPASSTSPSQAHASARAPLPRLYWCFLTYQRFLDRKADEIEKKGGTGTELRESLQRRLGFSTYQFELIREAAQKLDSDLKQKDAQAQAIIDAFHAKYPPNQPLIGPLPPPPPELAVLQQERENLIEQDVANLKSELGPDAAAKLDSFLSKDFAPAVKTRPLNAKIPSDRTSTPSGAVQKAVQP